MVIFGEKLAKKRKMAETIITKMEIDINKYENQTLERWEMERWERAHQAKLTRSQRILELDLAVIWISTSMTLWISLQDWDQHLGDFVTSLELWIFTMTNLHLDDESSPRWLCGRHG